MARPSVPQPVIELLSQQVSVQLAPRQTLGITAIADEDGAPLGGKRALSTSDDEARVLLRRIADSLDELVLKIGT